MAGILYLCATPIGNLEDMTFRAIRTLKEADLIAAEDTRNSIRLLNHFEIQTPMTSYHEYNKYDKGRKLIEKLLEGKNIALITDAGTPGISDPGEELVSRRPAVLGRQLIKATPWLTERHGYDPTFRPEDLRLRRFCPLKKRRGKRFSRNWRERPGRSSFTKRRTALCGR